MEMPSFPGRPGLGFLKGFLKGIYKGSLKGSLRDL